MERGSNKYRLYNFSTRGWGFVGLTAEEQADARPSYATSQAKFLVESDGLTTLNNTYGGISNTTIANFRLNQQLGPAATRPTLRTFIPEEDSESCLWARRLPLNVVRTGRDCPVDLKSTLLSLQCIITFLV